MEITVDLIKEKLDTDYKWLTRGIAAIYNKQTEDEKQEGFTKYYNNMGFNGSDCLFLSSIAQQLIKNRNLTDKQIYVCRKRMKKYAGQLFKIACKQI